MGQSFWATGLPPGARTVALPCATSNQANRISRPLERFNRTFRHEVLDAYVFESLDQEREISAEWMRECNEKRPHDTLDGCLRPCFGLTKPSRLPIKRRQVKTGVDWRLRRSRTKGADQ